MAFSKCTLRYVFQRVYAENLNLAGVQITRTLARCISTRYEDNCRTNHKRTNKRGVVSSLACAGAFVSGVLLWQLKNQDEDSFFVKSLKSFRQYGCNKVLAYESAIQPGKIVDGLPTYSRAEVAVHDSVEKKIWVTFGNGVYDVTEYVGAHPGGNKILMAAGKSIEPYWNIYSAHKNEEIYEVLETLRIGNITEPPPAKEVDQKDPYRKDPERSPILIPCSEKPFNAEPPAELLVDMFLTPKHAFFVRNHLPVPCLKLENYALQLELPDKNSSMKYDELKSLPKSSVTAVTQCAGNRRSEMIKMKPVKGLNWRQAAISNAKWSGVSLNDLLKHHGIDIDKIHSKYIVFEGMDLTPEGAPYGASIPMELAKTLKDVIIIAYEMNGGVIPRDHGFPVRVMIPGVVGARQVKWLNKIYFSSEESTSHWQRNDYKGFNSSVDWDSVNFEKSVSITQMPVVSAICDPVEGTSLEKDANEVLVKGYAWSGGGRGIIRVDISADGGKTWMEANLKPNGQTPYTSYAWTLWEAYVPLPKNAQKVTLVVKAVDISYNTQPDSVEGVWNLRGVLNNAWHRVNITVGEDQEKEDVKSVSKQPQEKKGKSAQEKKGRQVF